MIKTRNRCTLAPNYSALSRTENLGPELCYFNSPEVPTCVCFGAPLHVFWKGSFICVYLYLCLREYMNTGVRGWSSESTGSLELELKASAGSLACVAAGTELHTVHRIAEQVLLPRNDLFSPITRSLDMEPFQW